MENDMKKKLVVIFVFTTIVASSFADKSRFYENGKVVDTMYVNSKEGLRIRNAPNLSGEKLCAIPHEIQVKVVAVGKEMVIDGIKDPWIEILIPRYLWSGDEPEYGWVFGGYLSNRRANDELPLELRLQLHEWGVSNSCMVDFCVQGFNSKTFSFTCHNLPGLGGQKFTMKYTGTWKVKNETIFLEGTQSFYECNNLVVQNNSYKTQLTEKDYYASSMLRLNILPLIGYPEIEMPYGYKSLLDINTLKESDETRQRFFPGYRRRTSDGEVQIDFSKLHIYYDAWSDFGDDRDTFFNPLLDISDYLNGSEHLIQPLIEAGVDPRYSNYVEQYRKYWDPIMSEHQKKADEME